MTDKLELKSSHEVVHTVYVTDVESIFYCKPDDPDILTVLMKDGKRLYCDEVCPVDSLQEEPVSEDLEEVAEKYAYTNWESDDYHEGAAEGLPFDAIGHTEKCFKAGAEWLKEQYINEGISPKDAYFGHLLEESWAAGRSSGINEYKKQMMKDAVEGYVDQLEFPGETFIGLSVNPEGLKNGEEVKLIIIKQEEK